MDIADYVMQELKDSHFGSKLAYGIVLTGGSALLKDLDTLFNRVTKMEVRIAAPDTGISDASLELVDNPAYATVTGLLLLGAAQGASSLIVEHPPVRVVDEPEIPVEEPEPAEPERPATNHRPTANPTHAIRPRTTTQPGAKTTQTAQQPTAGNRPASRPVNRIQSAAEPVEPLPAPETFRHVPPKRTAPKQLPFKNNGPSIRFTANRRPVRKCKTNRRNPSNRDRHNRADRCVPNHRGRDDTGRIRWLRLTGRQSNRASKICMEHLANRNVK